MAVEKVGEHISFLFIGARLSQMRSMSLEMSTFFLQPSAIEVTHGKWSKSQASYRVEICCDIFETHKLFGQFVLSPPAINAMILQREIQQALVPIRWNCAFSGPCENKST
jgi:hypothetical protein